MLLTKVFEKGLSKVTNVFSPTCTQNRKCCLKLFGIEQCFSTFCCQRNWEKLQQWFRGSLNVWQSISPIYTPLATTDHPSIPAEKHVIPPPPKKSSIPSPRDRSLKGSFHLTEKDWGASQLYCPCWVSRGCWGSLSTGVKSLRICASYSTRPRYSRFYVLYSCCYRSCLSHACFVLFF